MHLLQVRVSAREEPERPANALIDPLMLGVWAERSGQSPLTMTVGTDLGRKWHAPMMALLFISICNMWVRIRSEGQEAYGAFTKLGRDTLEFDYVRILFRSKPILSEPEELVANVVMGRF